MVISYKIIESPDLPEFFAKRWEFQKEESPRFSGLGKEDFVEECLAQPQDRNWIHFGSFLDQSLISTASLYSVPGVPRPWNLNNRIGYLTNVYTIPGHRGRGVGTALGRKVMEWASSHDLELVLVWPSGPSLPFYERLGFVSEGQPKVLKLREFE